MVDDIVTRLREQVSAEKPCFPKSYLTEAADEIERLRNWASYEHAGYCSCAGGNAECVKKSYEIWKSMQ